MSGWTPTATATVEDRGTYRRILHEGGRYDDTRDSLEVCRRRIRSAQAGNRVETDPDADERAKLIEAIDSLEGYRVIGAVPVRDADGNLYLARAGKTDPAQWRPITLGGGR